MPITLGAALESVAALDALAASGFVVFGFDLAVEPADGDLVRQSVAPLVAGKAEWPGID